jgi:hypothetical protein
MIALPDVKATYAAMSDGELQHLLQEAGGLRRDAYLALKQECRKRNIFFELVQETEENLVATKNDRIRDNFSKVEKAWWKAAIAYAFEQKFNNATNDAILAGLIGMHASNEEALHIENNLEKLALKELDDAGTDTLSGITKTVCGTAVIVIVWLAALGNSMMIYGGLIMVAGLVQIANAASRKSRFRTILENIAGPVE